MWDLHYFPSFTAVPVTKPIWSPDYYLIIASHMFLPIYWSCPPFIILHVWPQEQDVVILSFGVYLWSSDSISEWTEAPEQDVGLQKLLIPEFAYFSKSQSLEYTIWISYVVL